MRRPILTRALSLAAENRRLKDDCEQLLVALHLANDCTDKARMDLRRVAGERDAALAVVVGLRTDVAGYQRINAALMESTPSDARSLDG
jgi:hypothetical protein